MKKLKSKTDELNKQAEEVQKSEDAAGLIKQYEDIIRTKKKGIVTSQQARHIQNHYNI